MCHGDSSTSGLWRACALEEKEAGIAREKMEAGNTVLEAGFHLILLATF